MDSTLGDLKGTSDDASDMLSDARTTLDKVSGKLRSAGAELASFNSTLSDALNSGDMGMVKEVLGNDPETLASTLAAPVQLRRKAVFPVANFGSSMAPFYTLLPLWVGALLMVVTLKTTVSRRTRKALGDPRPHRLFLGHYGVFALIALLQSTVSLWWRFAVPARAGRASAAVYVVWMAGLAGVLVLHLYDGGEFRQCG